MLSILSHTSFGSLDAQQQQVVRNLFDQTYQSAQRLNLDNNQLFDERKLIPISYEFYSKLLEDTEARISLYRNLPEQRKILENNLLFAFYIFSAQYQLSADLALNAAESKRHDLRTYAAQIKTCSDLIYQLRHLEQTPENQHVKHVGEAGHLAYLGLGLAPQIVADVNAITSGDPNQIEALQGEGTTVRAKAGRNAINAPRLYWVWAGNWIQTWISLLSDHFIRRQQALDTLATITPFTGFLSFGLYLTNASFEILMVAKHTIVYKGWMSEGEYGEKENSLKKTSWERFKAHADLRKYSIINDFIWGLGNLACFLYLKGPTILGYYGNIATTGLLLMDVVVSGFIYLEEKKQHQENIGRYEFDINKLKAEGSTPALVAEIEMLEKAKARCVLDWEYKRLRMIKDLSYATGLMLAFTAMCCFLVPPAMVAPATSLFLGVAGGAVCFVGAVINDAAGGYIDALKLRAQAADAKKEVEKGLLDKFAKEPNEDLKKLLYIEMAQLRAEHDYQTELANYQMLQVAHTIMLKFFIPPLVVSSLIFFPLGMGSAIIAAGFALAYESGKLYIGEEPKKGQSPVFNEQQYKRFANKPQRTFDELPRFFGNARSLGTDGNEPEVNPGPAK